jgi:hypothetical protein
MRGGKGGVGTSMTIARGEVASLSSLSGGWEGGRDIVVIVVVIEPLRRQCGGEIGAGGQQR